MECARPATLNAKDASTDAITVLLALLDTTNWVLLVSRLATPTCLLTTLPTSVFHAQISAKLAAVSLSAPSVPILRLSQSMESATTAHILATHAPPHHPPAQPVLLDST